MGHATYRFGEHSRYRLDRVYLYTKGTTKIPGQCRNLLCSYEQCTIRQMLPTGNVQHQRVEQIRHVYKRPPLNPNGKNDKLFIFARVVNSVHTPNGK